MCCVPQKKRGISTRSAMTTARYFSEAYIPLETTVEARQRQNANIAVGIMRSESRTAVASKRKSHKPSTVRMSTLRSSRSKRRLYTQSRSSVKLFILSLPVALIFLSSPLVREEAMHFVGQTFSNRTTSSSVLMDSATDSTLPTIVYEQVTLTRTDADTIRYAAFVVEGPSSRKPLSIGHWADLLANGSDEMSKSMAEGITSILKVSEQR